jgi:DNA-binding MarR family transcriptional regulator
LSTSSSAAAIGARLRRLSERIDQDCARLYAERGLHFEQRWLGLMTELAEAESLSVKELAARLGISHASVSETRKSVVAAGLVDAVPDPHDARSVRLSLSTGGREMFTRYTPLWQALEAASTELDAEADRVVRALDLLDQALDRESIRARVVRRLNDSAPIPVAGP